jgi:hypothetical protein
MRRIVRDYIAAAINRAKPQLEQFVAVHLECPEAIPLIFGDRLASIREVRVVKITPRYRADFPEVDVKALFLRENLFGLPPPADGSESRFHFRDQVAAAESSHGGKTCETTESRQGGAAKARPTSVVVPGPVGKCLLVGRCSVGCGGGRSNPRPCGSHDRTRGGCGPSRQHVGKRVRRFTLPFPPITAWRAHFRDLDSAYAPAPELPRRTSR